MATLRAFVLFALAAMCKAVDKFGELPHDMESDATTVANLLKYGRFMQVEEENTDGRTLQEGVATMECVDNDTFADEMAVSPRPPPATAWGGTCIEWGPYDCTKASQMWGYTPTGQADILRNCPASCDQCEASEAIVEECPVPHEFPLFDYFFDVQCLSDMPATSDMPCPVDTAFRFFKKFADEYRAEAMVSSICLIALLVILCLLGGAPTLSDGNSQESAEEGSVGMWQKVAFWLVQVVMVLQWITLALSGVALAWSYATARALFSDCMVKLDFAASSPIFLDLVVIPCWFALPPITSLMGIMALYCFTGFAILEVSFLFDSAYRVILVYPFGVVGFAYGLTLLYVVSTFMILFAIVFLPISIINSSVIIILGMLVAIAYKCSEPVEDFVDKFFHDTEGSKAPIMIMSLMGMLVFAPVLSPSIVLGSMLGWKAYEGNPGALMGHLYNNVFYASFDPEVVIPAFSLDFTLMGQIHEHVQEALPGFDPTQYVHVSTGLVTLNFVLSTIKPILLVANLLISRTAEQLHFETASVGYIYGNVGVAKENKEKAAKRRKRSKEAGDQDKDTTAAEAARASPQVKAEGLRRLKEHLSAAASGNPAALAAAAAAAHANVQAVPDQGSLEGPGASQDEGEEIPGAAVVFEVSRESPSQQ